MRWITFVVIQHPLNHFFSFNLSFAATSWSSVPTSKMTKKERGSRLQTEPLQFSCSFKYNRLERLQTHSGSASQQQAGSGKITRKTFRLQKWADQIRSPKKSEGFLVARLILIVASQYLSTHSSFSIKGNSHQSILYILLGLNKDPQLLSRHFSSPQLFISQNVQGRGQ